VQTPAVGRQAAGLLLAKPRDKRYRMDGLLRTWHRHLKRFYLLFSSDCLEIDGLISSLTHPILGKRHGLDNLLRTWNRHLKSFTPVFSSDCREINALLN